MANLRDFTGKNRIFTGTEGIIPSDVTGVTGDRVDIKGKFRYNSTIELMEYYNGTTWIVIDAPPTISAVSPDNFNDDAVSVTLTITGGNFSSSGLDIKMFNNSGTEITLSSITRVSSSSATAILTVADALPVDEPYDIQVINGSGLAAILEDAVSANESPTWTTASGSLGTLLNSARGAANLSTSTLVATDPEGGDVDYFISSGTLPSGLTLNSETGEITGTADAETSNTTYNFTVQAYDTASNFTARSFSIAVNAPSITTFNSPGTFTVPAGLTSVDVLIVAGGGGGGAEPGNNGPGGGGAGGLIFRPGHPITPATPISVTVGSGGAGGNSTAADAGSPGQGIIGGAPNQQGANGQDSIFSGLTAKGGGGGACPDGVGPGTGDATPGGSGGGAVAMGTTPNAGGSATQPSQPGNSGTFGFGTAGGSSPEAGQIGAGGGGAGTAGGNGSGTTYDAEAQSLPSAISQGFGKGGSGRAYSISGSPVLYAGGGSGHIANSSTNFPGVFIPGGPGGGGNGGWQVADDTGSQTTRPGTANRGGGGGGGRPGHGGGGGSGVVIVQS
jgi:hypothetical protein